jgi:signal peptidase
MKTILKILKGIITLFLCVVLLIVIFQKFTKNKVALGNIYIFQVVSESMMPEYKIGDIIVVKKTNPVSLKIGDDVTYVGSNEGIEGITITHRIIRKREVNGKYYFTTQGINNAIEDPEISEDNIYGKVIYKTILFSFVGRLMTNMVIYYVLFVSVGVAFSYEVVTSFFMKDKDEDE